MGDGARWTRQLRTRLAIAVVVLLLSTLTACTLSAAGGIIGGAGALAFAAFFVLGSSSQAGCGPKDPHANVCLSMPYIPEDAGPIENVELPSDAGVSSPPDTQVPIRPCLDVTPCLQPPRDPPAGACLWMDFDRELGAFDELAPPSAQTLPNRARSLDKLADKLPADVVSRLRGED